MTERCKHHRDIWLIIAVLVLSLGAVFQEYRLRYVSRDLAETEARLHVVNNAVSERGEAVNFLQEVLAQVEPRLLLNPYTREGYWLESNGFERCQTECLQRLSGCIVETQDLPKDGLLLKYRW
jgi:hypothetical protein